MIRAHRAAVEQAIEAAGVNVYEPAKVPADPEMPYALVDIDPGSRSAYRLSSESDNVRFRLSVRYFGVTTAQAEWAAEHVDDALADVPLDVSGRDCTPCRNESGRPVALDDTDDPHLFGGSSVWTFTSTPA